MSLHVRIIFDEVREREPYSVTLHRKHFKDGVTVEELAAMEKISIDRIEKRLRAATAHLNSIAHASLA